MHADIPNYVHIATPTYTCVHIQTYACTYVYACILPSTEKQANKQASMCARMNAWMDGWMDGWMYGWMDECVDAWMCWASVLLLHGGFFRGAGGLVSAYIRSYSKPKVEYYRSPSLR